MTDTFFFIAFCIFGLLFLASGALHLAACWTNSSRLQAFTKPLLMLLLSAAVSMYAVQRGNGRLAVLISVPLLLGMLGDIFLLKPDGRRFMLGAASFLAEHVWWILFYIISAGVYRGAGAWPIIGGTAVYLAALAALYVAIGKPAGIMGMGIIIYGAVLCLLHFTSIVSVIRRGAPWFFVLGTSLFLLSDSLLGYSLCKKKFFKSDFFVMLTYIPAQLLIAAAATAFVPGAGT